MYSWSTHTTGFIIIISLSWRWATGWPVPVSHIQNSLQRSTPWDLPVVKMSPEWVTGQEHVSPAVGLLPLASGPACLGMAFPPLLVKQCDSVVISSFVRTGYTTRRWGWLLGRIRYSITRHYPLYRWVQIYFYFIVFHQTQQDVLYKRMMLSYSKSLLIPGLTRIGRNM